LLSQRGIGQKTRQLGLENAGKMYGDNPEDGPKLLLGVAESRAGAT